MDLTWFGRNSNRSERFVGGFYHTSRRCQALCIGGVGLITQPADLHSPIAKRRDQWLWVHLIEPSWNPRPRGEASGFEGPEVAQKAGLQTHPTIDHSYFECGDSGFCGPPRLRCHTISYLRPEDLDFREDSTTEGVTSVYPMTPVVCSSTIQQVGG